MASLPDSLFYTPGMAVCRSPHSPPGAFARAVPSAGALAPLVYPPPSPVYSSAPSLGVTPSRKPSLLPDSMCYVPIPRGALVAKHSCVYGLGLELWVWFCVCESSLNLQRFTECLEDPWREDGVFVNWDENQKRAWWTRQRKALREGPA